ncbi:MAG: O-antigen ligase family protein [Acidimicrobiales bacterium]
MVPTAAPPRASLEGEVEQAATDVDADARTAAALVALLAFTIPLAWSTFAWSTPGGAGDWNRSIVVAPFDVVLLVVAGWALLRPHLLGDLFRRRAVAVAVGLYAAWFVVTFAAHASWLGVNLAVRLGLGLAVIAVVGAACRTTTSRRLALGALAASGVLQAALGMVQSARGEALGIQPLDYLGPLYPFGASHAGRGGLTHPYHLAVFLVLCQGAALLGLRAATAERRAGRAAPSWPWLAALAVIGAGIAITYSRAALVGQIVLVVCLLLARADRRTTALAVGAIALGLLVGAVGFGDGWVAKGDITTGSSKVASADGSRSKRLKEAKSLIDTTPVLGVGPGRYVDALAETDLVEYLPAHDLIAQDTAEMGYLGGLLALALLALLALRALRGGAWTAALVGAMVPFLLLDAYPYVFATGLAISALWLGLARSSLDAPEPTP